jgi:hypothetical protein
LETAIVNLLSDEERSGCRAKFTAEQLARLMTLACQEPKELGLPVTHWTPHELALCAQQLLQAQGTHVVSCDEKTGIQALERAAPTRPVRPGRDERREFEYIRHGTVCLMANLLVATGKVIAPTVGSTRSEEDFCRHIRKTVATDPKAGADLGRKGKHGILHDTESRSAFLSESAHRVRFVYTPKHCSWLNQVETWFSILSRRALKRASFVSTEELGRALLAFIDYFNRLLAKPFRWTYKGRPLTV